jgi:hypothetical protein
MIITYTSQVHSDWLITTNNKKTHKSAGFASWVGLCSPELVNKQNDTYSPSYLYPISFRSVFNFSKSSMFGLSPKAMSFVNGLQS